MSEPLNRASRTIQALTDFLLDTKPYHSKLTEVGEELQFNETMTVLIEEGSFLQATQKAAWPYGLFSSGNPSAMQIQQVLLPGLLRTEHNSDQANSPGRFKPGRDENTDMASVPLVFSKKQFDGLGIADSWLELGGTTLLPYIEGIDSFQSHGSMELQIKQTLDASLVFRPMWAETRLSSSIAQATFETQQLEQDLNRPQSAVNQLITFITSIQAHLNLNPSVHPGWTEAVAACTSLLDDLISGVIPPPYAIETGNPDLVLTGDYDTLLNGAVASSTPPPSGYAGWIGEDTPTDFYIDEKLSSLLPPLLFGTFSDAALWESGQLTYADVVTPSISITDIVANPAAIHEEWTLKVINAPGSIWSVTGSETGAAGTVTAGSSYSSTSLSFNTQNLGPAVLDDEVVLTPLNRVVVHPSAALETWNIIKVNPLAYTRPTLASTRYGRIQNLAAEVGRIDVLDAGFSAGTFVLAAVSSTTFSISFTAEPSYTGTATVGTTFNDGRIAFTILPGSARPFQVGDYFLIQITTVAPTARGLDLFYGYDLDSFDNPDLVYNNTDSGHVDYNRKINFAYDSRFDDYDINQLNLQITDVAVDERKFRLVAVPNLTSPIATLKRDGTTISNSIDLSAEDDELVPVSATGTPVFSMPGDANPAVDLQLYYATQFQVEWSDDDFVNKTVAGLVNVGGSFSDPVLGISFSLPAGSKPFIAVSADDGLAQPRVEGGDLITFTVDKPAPVQLEPSGLTGSTAPRLIMHGDSFYDAPAANWTVSFSSATSYVVTGTYASGPSIGNTVTGYPVSGTLLLTGADVRAGATFRTGHLHFTIEAGRGLGAGDSFTFSTHEIKPSFLVHGSVSGWAGNAAYDRWYQNGKIGFKINSPSVEVFDAATLPTRIEEVLGFHSFPVGYVQVQRVRPDTPSLRYQFTRSADGWLVRRSDVDVLRHAPLTGIFNDQYLTLDILDTTEDFTVLVVPDAYSFWNAQDTVIVRSPVTTLNPGTSDFVQVRKTESGTVLLNIDYANVAAPPSLLPLKTVTLGADQYDHSTNLGGIPLNLTSPEVDLLGGWIPTYLEPFDTTDSPAEFPDRAALIKMYSAGTGDLIGTVTHGTGFGEPTLFTFDPTFSSTYLPLNTEFNVIALGTGLDDNVRVHITEQLNVLIAGGAIFDNVLFNENISIAITQEQTELELTITTDEPASIVVADGPFTSFEPGFDNLPYDAEDALGLDTGSLGAAQGQFDTGLPLVDHFLRAQYLAGLGSPTSLEVLELQTLIALVGFHLQPGGILATSLPEFLAALDADGYALGGLSPTFGIPTVGAALDMAQQNTDVAGTSIQEAFFIQVTDIESSFDSDSFDSAPLDALGQKTALLFSSSLPPVPTGAIPGTYAALITPLDVGMDVSVFDITFTTAPPSMATPTIQYWRPLDPAPITVETVQVVSNGRFRFSVAVPTPAKLIIT